MTSKTTSMIASLAAGSALAVWALAGAAMAHPGGGGGGGGGFGGGVGGGFGSSGGNFGGGFGHGAGDIGGARGNSSFGHDNSLGNGNSTHPASVDAKRSVSPTSTPAVLDKNDKVDGALTEALTRKGIVLPAGGLKTACAGFGALGQCVAALHVAKNLDIPGGFDAVKAAATAPHSSLGEAIMKLRPSADALGEARKANRQADSDLNAAG